MSVMPEWFQEQEQEEKEEREAKRRANLDEWRRIAKMLRDLEYIKVPVSGTGGAVFSTPKLRYFRD